MTDPIDPVLMEELRALLARATARPWVAFDESGVRAIMKGKRPPSKENGYPVRCWPEIVAWTGFDASDVPQRYRSPNLRLIVGAVNALPDLLATIESMAARIAEQANALRQIKAGSTLGREMFEQRMDGKKSLTWYAVNVLQDNLAACEGTASAALTATDMMRGTDNAE